MERLLILQDGSVYRGKALGSDNFKVGELVFHTGMTGYQEVLTDNNNCGNIVMMTYPLIGNCGINRDDYKGMNTSVFGFVMKDYCEVPSNFRCQETLNEFLTREDVAAIYDVDTRAITRKLRSEGTMKATFANVDANVDEIVASLNAADTVHNQVELVASKEIFLIPNSGKRVVLIDCGSKLEMTRELAKRDCEVIVVPFDTTTEKIMSFKPDGIVVTEGPGNPEDLVELRNTIAELMPQVPMFGVGLGHELIALACGAKTYKLKFGHRGGNHPVVDLATKKVEITSQNHGYAVDIESLKDTRLEMTHQALNDKSCKGIRHLDYPCFSVQYHPSTAETFDRFVEMMNKEGK